mmetsp:Transcript_7563/g.14014  ORF Transcript_7563/g.14014 Transcript_7563/m.14014 type:complete len:84 (+) Transcript_7563:68-319(+)
MPVVCATYTEVCPPSIDVTSRSISCCYAMWTVDAVQQATRPNGFTSLVDDVLQKDHKNNSTKGGRHFSSIPHNSFLNCCPGSV